MKIISLMNRKGGAGKSTLAAHLTAAAAAKGIRVQAIDCDPQGSLMAWSDLRQDSNVRAVTPELLRVALKSIEADLVIIDTPGYWAGMDTMDPMSVADLVVVPVRPSVFDVAATYPMLDLLKDQKKKGLVVISAAPLRAPEIGVARAALSQIMPVAKTIVHDRRPFSRAIQTGRAVGEIDPKSPAAIEINLLLAEIMETL